MRCRCKDYPLFQYAFMPNICMMLLILITFLSHKTETTQSKLMIATNMMLHFMLMELIYMIRFS
jgi:hypothetical protein